VPDNEELEQISKKGHIQDPNVPFSIKDELSDLVIDHTEDGMSPINIIALVQFNDDIKQI
jgi:hypothetical protein